MNDVSDHQLLRDYSENRSETAFGELVRRHVDFVYSAALRLVGDRHLAEDVTQSAFAVLAEHAAELTAHPVLTGWLHCTTRNLAAKIVRADVRRRAREQEAAAMNELLSTDPDPLWKQIAPHLDTALGELEESDRDALLLRYFERKSAREMAKILNTSETAAQKRVSRAVERLREFFSKRGIAIGASGLVVVISTNAVQSAPLTLAGTISTATTLAGTTIHISTALVTKAIAMTAMQKFAVVATATVLIGAGIYEAHQAAQLRQQFQTLQQWQVPFAEQVAQLEQQNGALSQKIAALRDENEAWKRNSSELLKLRAEVGLLRQATNDLGKLREENHQLTQSPPPSAPKTDDEILQLMKDKHNCAHAWMEAFINYANNHQGQLPNSFEEAATFWPPYVGTWPDVKPDEFEILYSGSLNAITNREAIVFREKKLWQHIGGKWGRFDVLASGQVQYGSVPPGFANGDFTDWEKERIVSVANQN